MKHFEIVSSAHFFLQEELILNIPAGLSGDVASFSPDYLFFCVYFLKDLLEMFIHLQPRIAQMYWSLLSLWLVPLAAVFGHQCISKEQLSLMQLG